MSEEFDDAYLNDGDCLLDLRFMGWWIPMTIVLPPLTKELKSEDMNEH